MAKKRPGKHERHALRLVTAHRQQQLSDNLTSPLPAERVSITPSAMGLAYLKSKGARGGSSPYGRTERYEPKGPRKLAGDTPLFDQIKEINRKRPKAR